MSSLTSRTNIVPISSGSDTHTLLSSSTTLSITATTRSTSSTGQTHSSISTPDSTIVTATSSTTVPTTVPIEGAGSITMPSSIMGSDSHSDNHQTESTNSNMPNTQFNTIRNTITKTTDRTIVSDKTTKTAPPAVPSKTESIISTTASRGPTIQSSTGDSNTTTLIAAVISTVLILLVVSILVIIIVSVLMYKRRKRLTLKVSSGQDNCCHANPVYSDTTTVGDDKEMKDMSNPNYQSQGIILIL